MRFRTFISVMALLGLAGAVVFLLLPNRAVLEQPVTFTGRVVPVWFVVLLAFAVGGVMGLFFQLSGAGRGAAVRLRSMWTDRHRQAASKALDQGRHAQREERHDDAIASYREATERSPADYRAQMALGDALRRAGRAAEAVVPHERARRLAPDNEEAAHALALDHLEARNLDEARRELVALVDRHPKGAIGTLRKLRDLEMLAGRWSAAAEAQKRLESTADRGRSLSNSDRLQGLGIRTELARARAAAGQLRSALGLVRKAVADDGAFVPARILLAELLDQTGQTQEARDVLIGGFTLVGEPALLDQLADLDLGRERPEDAISTLRGLVAGGRHQTASRLALGKLYLRLEMLDEAAQRFDQLMDTEGQPALVASLLARTEERRGNLARAAALYRSVLDSPERAVPEAACHICQKELAKWDERCPDCGTFGSVATIWRTTASTGRAAGASASAAPIYPSADY